MNEVSSKKSVAGTTNANKKIRWAFFGSSHFSVVVLDELEKLGVLPDLVVTTPDKPRGRGLEVQVGEVRGWAKQRSIPVLAPASLRAEETLNELSKLGPWDFFMIASYGKIVPAEILKMPSVANGGVLNIHPSLLPKLRGPAPLEGAILHEKETGVTIMLVDEQVDHGPIVAQKKVPMPVSAPVSDWPPYYHDLETTLARAGAQLFAEILPDWLNGKIQSREQDHAAATFTKKFAKSELELDLNAPAETNLRKIRAFSENRGAYFFVKQNDAQKRVIVTRASLDSNGNLKIEKVKPEGKKEMAYEDFQRGQRGLKT